MPQVKIEEADLAAASVLSSLKSSGSPPDLRAIANEHESHHRRRDDLLRAVEVELDALLPDRSDSDEPARRSERRRRAERLYLPEMQIVDRGEGSSRTTSTTTTYSTHSNGASTSQNSSPLTSLPPSPLSPFTSRQASTSSSATTQGNGKRHVCPHPECGITTSRASDMRRHLLTHSTQSFLCEHCGCQFGRKDGVVWHQRMGRCRGKEGRKGAKRGRKGGRFK